MQSLKSPNNRTNTLSIAYKNNFGIEMRNDSKRSGKAKSDSKTEKKDKTNWKKNIKKINLSKNSENFNSKGCIYDQSSMFLFAIPK